MSNIMELFMKKEVTYIVCMLLTYIPIVDVLICKFQFQCLNHVGYELCIFPDQYCDDFLQQCRPCSKFICDRINEEDFPLQCYYNCTASLHIEKIEEGRLTDNGKKEEGPLIDNWYKEDDGKKERSPFIAFIKDWAEVWFFWPIVMLLGVFVGTIGICVVRPYLNKRSREKRKWSMTDPERGPEATPLASEKTDDVRPGDEAAEQQPDDDPAKALTEKEETDTTPPHYCERTLKNVNPTDEHPETKKMMVTNLARLPHIFSTSSV